MSVLIPNRMNHVKQNGAIYLVVLVSQADTSRKEHLITIQLPSVSLITPTLLLPERIPYLLELQNSVHAAAEGLDLEWVIVIDGGEGELPESIAIDPLVKIVQLPKTLGLASARNYGLDAVTKEWVATVDDDDLLPKDSITRRLSAAVDIGVTWAAGYLADLEADGSLHVWDHPAKPGVFLAGEVLNLWGTPEGTFPFAPNTFMSEVEVLREVGGWQGIYQGEDFGMVMAITGQRDGIMVYETVYEYRKHDGQWTRSPDFPFFESTIRRVTFERGRLVAEPKKRVRNYR